MDAKVSFMLTCGISQYACHETDIHTNSTLPCLLHAIPYTSRISTLLSLNSRTTLTQRVFLASTSFSCHSCPSRRERQSYRHQPKIDHHCRRYCSVEEHGFSERRRWPQGRPPKNRVWRCQQHRQERHNRKRKERDRRCLDQRKADYSENYGRNFEACP